MSLFNAKIADIRPTPFRFWLLRLVARIIGAQVRIYKVRERKVG